MVLMRNPWLCITIVLMLGSFGLLCGVGIIILPMCGKPVPDSLNTMGGMALGALAAFLVNPPRGSVGMTATPIAVPPMEERIRAGV